MKIKSGDKVQIIAGKDRGKSGKVLKVFPKENKVLVEGMNVVKKHQRALGTGQPGQIVEKPMPVHVSNVAVLDPKDNKPTRVGYETKDGKKVRIARRSGAKLS